MPVDGCSRLTAYERDQRFRFNYTETFFKQAYAAVAAGPASCRGIVVHDLSGVFVREERPMFVDALHLSETGNQLVAGAMADATSDALGESTARAAGTQ